MNTFLGSFDSNNYKKILQTLKDEQKILKLEEMIDNEIIARQKLEQEAKLLQLLLEKMRNLKHLGNKRRSSSMFEAYEDTDFKKRAYARNTITSTVFRD
jgi:tRNA splicing endonuclease